MTLFLTQASVAKKRVLNLSNKGLTSVADLKLREGLKKLNLNFNEITDIDDLKAPDSLKNLSLFSNKVSNIDNFQFPSNLNKMDLSNNEIVSISNLKVNSSLETLSFFSNEINNFTVNLTETKIKSLDLGFNQLTDKNINLTNMPAKINQLFLGGNQFSAIDVSQLNNLKILAINDNPIDYTRLKYPDSLETLAIGTIFEEDDFSDLVLSDNLIELNIKNDFATLDEIKTINFPPNLKRLDLERNNLETLDGLELPGSLRYLNLRRNLLSKKEIKKIKRRFKGRKIRILTGKQRK